MFDRRNFISATAGLAAAGMLQSTQADAAGEEPADNVASQAAKLRYCLNVSTINNSKVDVEDQIATAAKAGYDGIELWLRDIERYTSAGKKLPDLRKRIADSGLKVESAIAFGQWVVNDDAARAKGLDDCRRDMEIVRELGGRLIAAPPTGATEGAKLDLDQVAQRYQVLLDIGRSRDCFPQLEVWGFAANFSRLAEVLYVLAAANDPDACVLPDVYHLYKGGSTFANIGTLAGSAVHVLHMNDYPANPPRESIVDADRVFPGDGVAPIAMILNTMLQNGFAGVLSLELFNRGYWQRDRDEIASIGLAKMKSSVEAAIRYAS